MTKRSHGDGRRMTLGEARGRRRRMLRFWRGCTPSIGCETGGPKIFVPHSRRHDSPDVGMSGNRLWAANTCYAMDWHWSLNPTGPVDDLRPCGAPAPGPDDIGVSDGIPVAMCADCRAEREPAVEFEAETLEDLAADFMADLARILPEPSCADPSPPQGEK